MNQQPRIFISYSRNDIEIAIRLYNDLKSVGTKPWITEYDLLPGENRKQAIQKAIKESDYVITLVSSQSIRQREFAQKEQQVALDLLDEMPESEIFIIPVRLDACEIPTRLENIYPTDLFPAYESGFNKILKVFSRDRRTFQSDQETIQDNTQSASSQSLTSLLETPSPPPSQESFSVGTDPETIGHKMPGWALKVSVTSTLVFLSSLLVIAVVIPHPTTFQIFVFRIILALASAAFGASIPGFFKIQLPLPAKGLLYASGGIGFFVLIFLVNPPELIVPNQVPPQIIIQKLAGTILDQNNEPLSGVQVSLPEKEQETYTNLQGFFSFELEAERQAIIRIMAQKTGFVTSRQDVMLGTTGHTFKMEEKL